MRGDSDDREENGEDGARQRNPNLVELAQLSQLDRRVVNEAFRQVRKLQQRLELDFPG